MTFYSTFVKQWFKKILNIWLDTPSKITMKSLELRILNWEMCIPTSRKQYFCSSFSGKKINQNIEAVKK